LAIFTLACLMFRFSLWIPLILWLISELLQRNVLGKYQDMETYRPVQTDERLTYRGNLMCLDVSDLKPYDAGYAHGRRLAWPICKLLWRFYPVYLYLLWFHSLDKWLGNVEIASHHQQELKGLVDGYNSSVGKRHRVTYRYALACHLLPDLYCMACSTVIFRNTPGKYDQSDIFIGRNMDFTSLGSAGSDSLLVKYHNVTSLIVPGLVGVVTGWNNHGVVGIVNVSHNKDVVDVCGIPIVFLVRSYLEKSLNVDHLWALYYQNILQPTVSFHFTFADKTNFGCISFYQTRDGVDTHLRDDDYPNGFQVFNYTYTQHETDDNTSDSYCRDECVARFRQCQDSPVTSFDVIKLLRQDELNVYDTMHSLVFNMSKGWVFIANNNCFAADSVYSTVTM